MELYVLAGADARSSFSSASLALDLPFRRLKSNDKETEEKLILDSRPIMTSGICTIVSTSKINILSPNRRYTVKGGWKEIRYCIIFKFDNIGQHYVNGNVWME